MKRIFWVSLAAVCLAAAVVLFLHLNTPALSDEDKIHQVLKSAEEAAENRNLKLAFSLVSPDYHDSAGLNSDGIKMQIVRALNSRRRYDVLIDKAVFRIQENTAHVDARVTISRIRRYSSMEEYFSGGVGINLKKEDARKWLVIPVKVWRVTSVEGVSELYGEY